VPTADSTGARSGLPGLFLVLEGIEGAGKSTQAALLRDWLASRGEEVTLTREPGGTPVGEAIRSVVLTRTDLDVGPETELLLILAARAAFVRDVVRPALGRGEVVVADRYELSTFAYQGYGRGLDLNEVRRLNDFATGGLTPDLCLVLGVSAAIGRTRHTRSGKRLDRIEREPDGFMARVEAGYGELATSLPCTLVVEGAGSEMEVQERIREALFESFPDRFGAHERS
jgi:dTMP kinase